MSAETPPPPGVDRLPDQPAPAPAPNPIKRIDEPEGQPDGPDPAGNG